ncbi:MAG: hypothetical protein JAZ17_20775 [Candidatus Thiodiazotropha endolucinida]|nr:hypothetical protein [Candidatus Thiodiazotropha endolucinida]
MKKFFIAALGITFGLILAVAIVGGGIYWWIEVRIPASPEVSVELDGFPDTRKQEDGKEKALVRILITNNEDLNLSISDAYLYLSRVSDGARTNLKFKVDNMVIYPKEKYVEIVETLPVNNEWFDFKGLEEFGSEYDYFAYKEKWITQLRMTFDFNFYFISDEHNIRILLDIQQKIAEIENKHEQEKNK